MQLSKLNLALTRIGKASFSPKSLFSSGSQGAWYDPSDLTTLFEDSAGTIPITSPLEKPVGLMLDKSKGLVLGPELVTNGTFDSSINGWTTTTGTFGSSVWIENSGNGAAKITNISGISTQFSQALAVTAGKTYQITANITYISGSISGSVSVRTSDSAATSSNLGGQTLNAATNTGVSFYYLALSTTTVYVGSLVYTSACSYSLDNISVRELPGNHATQSTTTSRPTLSARYNLLTKTEDFSHADWKSYNVTKTTDTLTLSGTVGGAYQDKTLTANTTYVLKNKFKKGTNDFCVISLQANGKYGVAVFDLNNGTVGETKALGTGWSVSASSISSIGDGWYLCSATITAGEDVSYPGEVFGFAAKATGNTFDSYGNPTGCTNGNTLYVKEADLRVANDGIGLPAYQRVNTATDYDYAGFPPYLKFDGTDDGMATGSIDFSATDKMSVFAGVRKIGTAEDQIVAQFGIHTDPGVFVVAAPAAATSNSYGFYSRGTIVVGVTKGGYPAPITNVLACLGNISGDQAVLRVNGSQAVINTADQGTGNYGNYPLYIGRRGGTTLPYNGRLYSLVVCGKLASAAEIASTENWVNQKTRAFA